MRSRSLACLALLAGAVASCDRREASGTKDSDPETVAKELAVVSGVVPVPTPQADARSEHHRSADDPSLDGWDSESFAQSALAQLDRIGELLSQPGLLAIDESSPLLAEEFSCNSLRPPKLIEVFADPPFAIRRTDGQAPGLRLEGREGFLQAVQALITPLGGAKDVHWKFKIFGVEQSGREARTIAYFQCDGRHPNGSVIQQKATWTCRWANVSGDPLLHQIDVADFEESLITGSELPAFADCTGSILRDCPEAVQQLQRGFDYWTRRLPISEGTHIFSRTGLAIGDVNGDQLDDLYLCQPGGLPNRLFVQNLDGTVSDWSHIAGVDWTDPTASALFVDLDNDGDQDLAVATEVGVLIAQNDGKGHFETRAKLGIPDQDVEGLSAADYDNDGDLDLYLCLYEANPLARPGESQRASFYHDNNSGGANILFRNDISSADPGSPIFKDVTRSVGLDKNNRRFSLAASWEDYDNDGDQDLYVANDFGQNCLYRNDTSPSGTQFVEIAAEAKVIDFGSGMSVSWGDYNRDGVMDLYVGNMFSSAGGRITGQARFLKNEDDSVRKIYQRLAKGNSLFGGQSGGTFVETGAQVGVEMGRWAWSSLFVDINNDGWEDLFVANGFHSTEDTGDL